jgi:hypothetical protein
MWSRMHVRFILVALLFLVSCREPTQIFLTIETDVPCADIKAFSYATGLATEIDLRPATSRIESNGSNFLCTTVGSVSRLGTLAIVPLVNKGDKIGIRATLRFDSNQQDDVLGHACVAGSPGCISQVVTTQYVQGRTSYLTMTLNAVCRQQLCAPGFSCFTAGGCQNREVTLCTNPSCTLNTNDLTSPRVDGGAAAGGGIASGGGAAQVGGGSSQVGGGTAPQGGGSAGGGAASAALKLTPGTKNFGSVALASSSTYTFILENLGNLAAENLVTQIPSNTGGFFVLQTDCPTILPASMNCQILVEFKPTAAGMKVGTLEAKSSVGMAQATLRGEVLSGASLSISPLEWDFMSVPVNGNSGKLFTVTNTGGVTSGNVVISVPSEYSVPVGGTCTGPLAAGASCTFDLELRPQTAGNKNNILTVSANPGGSATANILGTGAAGVALSLSTPVFPDTVTGQQSVPMAVTITNAGGTLTSAPASLSFASNTHFSLGTNTCTGLLGPNGTCTYNVIFKPMSDGIQNTQMTATAATASSAPVAISGTGLRPAALVALPSSLNFGMINANSAPQTLAFDIRNTGMVPSGIPVLTVTGSPEFSLVNSNPCTAAIAANATCTVVVRVTPFASIGTKMAAVNINASPGTATAMTVNLNAQVITPSALTLSLASAFGATPVSGIGVNRVITVTNTGTTTTGVLTAPAFSGANILDFTVVTNGCSAALPMNASCQITVKFAPTAAGSRSTNLSIGDGATSANLLLQGTGQAPNQSILPLTANFGTVLIGSFASQSFTVTNTGDAPSAIPSVTISGTEFSIFSNTCTTSLAALTGNCSVMVRLTPTTSGAKSGTLTVSANGQTLSPALSGLAQTPATLTVTPSTFSFPSTAIGTSVAQNFMVTNSGQQATGALSVVPSGTVFALATPTMTPVCAGQSLTSGATCYFAIQFTPNAATTLTGSVSVSATPGGIVQVSVSGIGSGGGASLIADGIVYAGGVIDFGGRATSTTPVLGTLVGKTNYVVKNVGTGPTGALFVNVSNGQFSKLASPTCDGVVLQPNGTCEIGLQFIPSPVGAASGTVTVIDTNSNTLVKSIIGKGQWKLQLSPTGGIGLGAGTCPVSTNDCAPLFDNNASVVVTAKTANGSTSRFQGWSGDMPPNCLQFGYGNKCDFTINASLESKVSSRADTTNLAFVTSVPVPLNFGSPAALSMLCNKQATTAGINDTAGNAFVALISANGVNASSRITSTGSFVRMDGELIAVNTADFFSDKIRAPISMDENYRLIDFGVTNNGQVMTATTSAGLYDGQGDCAGWTSTTATLSVGRTGRSSGGPGMFVASESTGASCASANLRIYCIQNTSVTTKSLAPVAVGGKIVFVTSAPYLPGVSATPLAFCDAQKPAGSVSIFKPFLATSTTSASVSAGIVAGTKYYRVDGAFVGTGSELNSKKIHNGIWVTGSGTFLPSIVTGVFTGADTPSALGTASSTCNNWTSSTTGAPIAGRVGVANADFFGGAVRLCNDTTTYLYCVEQ